MEIRLDYVRNNCCFIICFPDIFHGKHELILVSLGHCIDSIPHRVYLGLFCYLEWERMYKYFTSELRALAGNKMY